MENELHRQISTARDAIATAERELDRAMHTASTGPRAEKMLIGDTLANAFERVRAARQALADLETIVNAATAR